MTKERFLDERSTERSRLRKAEHTGLGKKEEERREERTETWMTIEQSNGDLGPVYKGQTEQMALLLGL